MRKLALFVTLIITCLLLMNPVFAQDVCPSASINPYHTEGSIVRGIAVEDTKACVSKSGSNILDLVDITDPTNPSLLDSFPSAGDLSHNSPHGFYSVIDESGNYCYFVDYEHLHIFEITDNVLNERSRVSGGSTWSRIRVVDGHAYIAGAGVSGYSNLTIINVSNPDNPVWVGNFDEGRDANGLEVVRGENSTWVYLANDRYGLDVLEVTFNPLNIEKRASWGTTTTVQTENVAVVDDTIYLAAETNGLQILKLESTNQNEETSYSISKTGEYNPGIIIGSVSILGDYAYLGTSQGLKIIDINNFSSAVCTIPNAGDNKVAGDKLYLGQIFNQSQNDIGFEIYDISNFVNVPPEVYAGENMTINSDEQSITTIYGVASDLDNDPLEYQWLYLVQENPKVTTVLQGWQSVGSNGEAWLDLGLLQPLGTGAHVLFVEANDGQITVRSDPMTLTINNSPPVVAPVGCGTYHLGEDITLSGSVADFDGDTLIYKWIEPPFPPLFQASVTTTEGGDPAPLSDFIIEEGLSLGVHTVILEVDDSENDPVIGRLEECIEVIDTEAPSINAVVYPAILWPPNHNMVDVVVEVNAFDNSGAVTLAATVTSNEPPDADADGNTIPDFTEPLIDQVTGLITLQLRAERSGTGDGRIYTITITATDISGNSSVATVEVVAPHDRGKKK
ncbi:MAG: hypothetical protein KAR05_10210 [Candidatus Omnitrophica bacterium]|nr:hypothetical protein [Candidatus Omnitrophota bacterium]